MDSRILLFNSNKNYSGILVIIIYLVVFSFLVVQYILVSHVLADLIIGERTGEPTQNTIPRPFFTITRYRSRKLLLLTNLKSDNL
jgi:hypothetical protein